MAPDTDRNVHTPEIHGENISLDDPIAMEKYLLEYVADMIMSYFCPGQTCFTLTVVHRYNLYLRMYSECKLV